MYLFDILFSFPLDIYPEVELLDYMAVLFLIFGETSTLFSIGTERIYISRKREQLPEALLQGKRSRNRQLWSPETTPRPLTASGRSAEEQQPGGRAMARPAQVAAALDLADISWGLQWPTPAAWGAALALSPPRSQ